MEQFLFDRSKQQNIASFITEPDIVEDNEDIEESSTSLEKIIDTHVALDTILKESLPKNGIFTIL